MKHYQYLRFPLNHFGIGNPHRSLCITLSTEMEHDGDLVKVRWAVAYKHPKDRFDKRVARDYLSMRPEQVLTVNKNYTRSEVLSKILSHVYYNDINLPKHYQTFVRIQMAESMMDGF